MNVGLEGGDRVPVGDAHNGLRGQVKDRVDFKFAQGSLQAGLVAHIATHDFDMIGQAVTHYHALWHVVAHHADDIGPGLNQTLHKPAAHKAGGASDHRGAIAPEFVVGADHDQTFQGAFPLFHMSLSI